MRILYVALAALLAIALAIPPAMHALAHARHGAHPQDLVVAAMPPMHHHMDHHGPNRERPDQKRPDLDLPDLDLPDPDLPERFPDHDLRTAQCLLACMAIETRAVVIGCPALPVGERLALAASTSPEGVSPPCPERPPRRRA